MNAMNAVSPVPADEGFGPHHLPYGSVRTSDGRRRAVLRLGTDAIELASAAPDHAQLFTEGSLDTFLAAGRPVWNAVRAEVTARLADEAAHPLTRIPLAEVSELLPFTVADYVDFYASEHHATNVGRIVRPDGQALTPNWKHQPIGYHGRAGTVVVSGSDIARPNGQTRGTDGEVRFGPSQRLDLEAEVCFVVGAASQGPVTVSDFAEHVFGVCLLNDWSARDIQSWEYVPLGPFLGKSFATTVSAWITPLEALAGAWVAPPPREPGVLAYLDEDGQDTALDLALSVTLNGSLIARPPFAGMYWTPAQMLAHLTSNGTPLRTGDIFGSGTVSGPDRDQRGSLLELSWGGSEPITLDDGGTRTFLEDGDEVVLSARCMTSAGPISLGEARGRIVRGVAHV